MNGKNMKAKVAWMPRHSKRLSKVERVAMKRYRSEILYVRVYNEGGSKMNKKKWNTHEQRGASLEILSIENKLVWTSFCVCSLCVWPAEWKRSIRRATHGKQSRKKKHIHFSSVYISDGYLCNTPSRISVGIVRVTTLSFISFNMPEFRMKQKKNSTEKKK